MGESHKLVMVEYLNTLPFQYGLSKNGSNLNLDYLYEHPANCFEMFKTNKASIALIPVGGLVRLDSSEFDVFSDFCIGCDGIVKTVCLYFNSKLADLKTIYLDEESQTSQLLLKILVAKFYKMNISYRPLSDAKTNLSEEEGILMIGDKVFENDHLFNEKIDLGEAWKKFTGLPFVFALWVTSKKIGDSIKYELNKCFHYGVNHIDNVPIDNKLGIRKEVLLEYLKQAIDFKFDIGKKKAFEKFQHFVKELDLLKE